MVSAVRSMAVAGSASATLGTVVVFVGALVASVVVHLDTPATRKAIATHVNAALAPERLRGDVIATERIGHIELSRASTTSESRSTTRRASTSSSRTA